MWLKLVNFRCHEEKEIEIPDSGFCGFCSNVGTGKTTILMGITYALYGKIPSKAKKVTTHGKTSTSVYFKYRDMSIERHSKPKRILVEYDGGEYEGDSAQSIIHTVMGATYEEFLLSSYVVQRGYVSILSLTPTEQVSFIETIANTLSEKYKSVIKKKIKDYSSILLNLQGQLQSLSDQKELKEQKYPEIPNVPTTLKKGESPEDLRKSIGILENVLKETEKTHSSCMEKYTLLVKKEKEAADLLKKLEYNKNKISHLQEIIKKETDQLSKIEIPEDIEELENKIKLLTDHKEYLTEKKKFETAKREHESSKKKKLETLKEKILPSEELENLKQTIDQNDKEIVMHNLNLEKWERDQEQKLELKNAISSLFISIKKIYRDASKITSPKEMLEFLNKEEKEVASLVLKWERKNGKKTKCPCCKKSIVVTRKMEVEKDDDIELPEGSQNKVDNYETLCKWLSKLNELSPLYYSIDTTKPIYPEDISDQRKKYQDSITSEYKYKELLKSEVPSILKNLEKRVERLYSEEAENISETLEELIDRKSKIEHSIREKNRLEASIKSNKSTIKSLSTFAEVKQPEPSAPYHKKLSEITDKILKLNNEIGAKRKVLDGVSDYEKYLENIKEVGMLEESIENIKKEIGTTENKLEGFYGLEQSQKEAEIIALEETVNTINEYAKFYLDKIFESPISIKLGCVKQKGKTYKLQITTKIFYKTQEYDCIDELSGGERQQADVAYMLAISDMFNTGLLFLDECLNEMDSTLNTQTMILLRDLRKEKLTLVISHEAVRGVYEKEITLE